MSRSPGVRISEFWRRRYAALPGLEGGEVAGLLGERIRQEGDVVEVGTTFFYRDPRDLARRFGEWLAGQGYELAPCPELVEGPADREGRAMAEAEVVLEAQERPGSGLAVACYRLVEKGAHDA